MKIRSNFYSALFFFLMISNFGFANQTSHSFKKGLTSSLAKSDKNTHSLVSGIPVVTVIGNTTYCPLTNTNIVTSISITDPGGNSGTDAIYIQISSGYVYGEDKLFLNNASFHTTITSSWNPIEGKLTLKSPTGIQVSFAEFENAIKDVQFYNSSSTATGTRNFSISTGQANYLPSNGHYYEFISDLGITWTNARDAAALKTYNGLQGYLATFTAADEVQLAGVQISGSGWIGGSDAAAEGVWKWETGPEAGTIFWNGSYFNGSTTNFAFWNNVQPDNQGGNENYAHITAPGIGIPGSWNDLKIDGESSGDNQPKGYIVEYGGTFGDPILQLSASTTLIFEPVVSIASTISASSCDAGSVTLQATATAGTINWFDSAVGGNNIGTGPSFTTPNLNTSTTYYVETTTTNCSSSRIAVEAKINITPTITNTNSPLTNCGPRSFTLTATSSVGDVNWYSQIGGTVLDVESFYNTPIITANTTYYAEANNNGCTNGIKVPIQLIVYPLPVVNDETVEKCTFGTVTLDASIPNMKYLWNTGETTQTIIVSTTGTYYVDVTSPAPESCTSRKTINVVENDALNINNITSTTPASRCDAGTVTLQATATGGTINWYDSQTGGNYMGTGSNFTTPNINATIIYYVETATANCSSGRTAVEAKINITPTIANINSPITNCGQGLFTLTATPSVGTVNWYSQIGGTAVDNGLSYITPPITTNTTYYAEANNNGCTNGIKVPVQLIVYPLPVVTDGTVEKCTSGTVTLDASIPNMKYLWNTGETTQTIIAPTTGFYTVDVTSPAPENCTSRKTITVIENNLLITDTTPASRCDSGIVTLQAVATGGTINWYNAIAGGNIIGTSSSFSTPNINATTTYYVETATANCSSGRTAVEAKINITPTITNTNSPLTNCGSGLFTLTATPSVGTVNWYSQIGGTVIGNGSSYITPTITENTTYYAEAINNGCTNSIKVPVQIKIYTPPAIIDQNEQKCNSETVILDATIPNMKYLWNTGETSQTIIAPSAGIYTVDITSPAPENCTSRKTITVIQNNKPEIKNIIVDETTATIELVKNEDYFEFSIDGNNFQSSNVFTNIPGGLQSAYVRDTNKCNTDIKPFIAFIVPKFFTPNNDGINDVWEAEGLSIYPLGEIFLFDRYGKLITHLNRQSPSWDGTFNKRPLPSSDYWYVIKLDPNSPELKGHFSLIR